MCPNPQEFTEEILNGKLHFFCGVRLDVCARGFLQAGQVAFFDLRVFNTNARRFVKQELSNAYKTNEKF